MSRTLELVVERAVAGGRMLARHEGRIVLVAGAIPGRTQTLAVGIYTFVETGREEAAWGLLLLFILVYFILAALLGFLVVSIGFENVIAQSVIQGLTAAITALLVAAMLASLYVELRTVKEGATTESLATIFE